MSELLQSGQHPDADQLSAFIEHALPAHEQEETLAHLAICPHCRSIVALSMPPADPLPQPHPEPERRRWMSGWMMVWPAGAALAALLLAGIYIRNGLVVQRHVPSTQTAQSRPPEQLKQLPPTLKLNLQAPESTTPHAAPVPETTQAADRLMPVPGAGGNKPHTNQNRMSSFGASTGPSGATAAHLDAVISEGAADQAIQTASPAAGGTLAVDQAQSGPGKHGLPSGLRALSTVANARQVVAIDTDNTLFFSNDAGAHWNVITPLPWKGRAVKVELVPASFSAFARNGAAAAAPAGIVSGKAEGPKAALSGEITDPAGASIPSASVAVTNSLTQVVHRTTTDATGRYTVDQLDPGTYTLEADAPGFTAREVSGLSLNAAQQSRKDLTLVVGALAQTVEVQGQTQPALAAPRVNEKIAARAAAPPVPRFEITTDAGEHWISTDGRSWQRKDE